MALSDYERRVLAEIEVELGYVEVCPELRRLRMVGLLAACLLPLAAVGVVAALWLPPAAAAGLCSAVGLAVGILMAFVRTRFDRFATWRDGA